MGLSPTPLTHSPIPIQPGGPKELKLGVELTDCLVLRTHLVRYLRGFHGIRLLAIHLEELQTKAELLAHVDEVLATGLKSDPPPDAAE